MSECADLCQWRSNADLTTMSCTWIARGLSLYYNLCDASSAILRFTSMETVYIWLVDIRLNNGRTKHSLQSDLSEELMFHSKWPTLRHLSFKRLFSSLLQFLSLNPFCLLCNSHFWLWKILKAKNNQRTCSCSGWSIYSLSKKIPCDSVPHVC